MPVFDDELLQLIEFGISAAWYHAADPAVRGLWCDGVLAPPNDDDALRKLVHDRRRLELDAFVGKDGQGRWTLVLHLGDRSVSRLARGLGLAPCVPEVDDAGWVVAHVEDRVVDVYLR